MYSFCSGPSPWGKMLPGKGQGRRDNESGSVEGGLLCLEVKLSVGAGLRE